jgi:MoxR-like ATPase
VTDPVVLLVDELDKADVEIEGLLLEILGPTSR